MPLTNQEAQIAQTIHDRAAEIGTLTTQLLGPAAIAPPSTEEKIELLQKAYGEVSNYDRHYSSVRSALTALLVTVGLAASADAFRTTVQDSTVSTHTVTSIILTTACAIDNWDHVLERIILTFLVTFLLFFMAILINVYFQRLTRACDVMERQIDLAIDQLSGLNILPPVNPAPANPIPFSYNFRTGFRFAVKDCTLYHFDGMAWLLIISISMFVAFAISTRGVGCQGWTLGKTFYVFGQSSAIAIGVALLVNAFYKDGKSTNIRFSVQSAISSAVFFGAFYFLGRLAGFF